MDDAAIAEALDASDVDFSGDDDEPEYLPPDADGPSSSESEDEQGSNEETPPTREFWLTKEIIPRGPDINEDDK